VIDIFRQAAIEAIRSWRRCLSVRHPVALVPMAPNGFGNHDAQTQPANLIATCHLPRHKAIYKMHLFHQKYAPGADIHGRS
jgi:hypothetical protein